MLICFLILAGLSSILGALFFLFVVVSVEEEKVTVKGFCYLALAGGPVIWILITGTLVFKRLENWILRC